MPIALIICAKPTRHTKFVSLEPLLGPLPNLDLTGIDWAIVGGESGPGARPMKPEWATDIRDQCRKCRFRSSSSNGAESIKKRAGRELDGRTWDEMPGSKPVPDRKTPARCRSIKRWNHY